MAVTLNVNGLPHSLDLDPDTPLIYVLRNDLSLHGAKLGCGAEQCGACVVLVDGEPIWSCSTSIGAVAGRSVSTVEGLADDHGHLHPIQQAFLELNAAQCGFCTAGILMRTRALLAENPQPSRSDICAALDGHLCRCGAHPRIIEAVALAAARLAAREP